MTAYYNEIDEKVAAWLRELIKKGLIADGVVDTRSIVAVEPADLRDFAQCHFFAGIAGWSLALRLAGWPDDRPVWTGSCPCQPFSAAGKRQGEADARHLWPEYRRLIEARRPPVIFGEQVASSEVIGTQLEADFALAVRQGDFARANKLAKRLVRAAGFHFQRRWIDAVQSDLAEMGYALRSDDRPAAGVGAPHIRQRLWFVGKRVADAGGERHDGLDALLRQEAPGRIAGDILEAAGCGPASGLADADDTGLEGRRGSAGGADQCAAGSGGVVGWLADAMPARWTEGRASAGNGSLASSSGNGGVADAECNGQHRSGPTGQAGRCEPSDGSLRDRRTSADHGGWNAADWLFCRDGKFRSVEPGTFPLAYGLPARVGRLRGYGNAIVPAVAATFIEAVMA